MYIDSHAHLLSKGLSTNINELILRAKEAHITGIINIACEPKDWSPYIALERNHMDKNIQLHTAIGIHPDHFNSPELTTPQWQEELNTQRIALEGVLQTFTPIAIGECGLDYYRTPHKEAQKALFIMQLELARKYKLPCVLHIRDAFDDSFDILHHYTDITIVFHCFTGNKDTARHIITTYNKAYISFSGVTTFANATDVAEAAAYVPLDRMFIETDSPYLAPVPLRGKINEPSYVIHTAAKIGELKGLSSEEIGKHTTNNVKVAFGIK